MRASALDEMVACAGEVLFERTLSSSSPLLPEFVQAGGDTWRQNGCAHIRPTLSKGLSQFQFDEASLEVSKQKSTMIHDLIKNYSQENAARVQYDPASHGGSEIHAEQNDSLERHEASQIEERVQRHICLKYQKPGETFCIQGIAEEFKK